MTELVYGEHVMYLGVRVCFSTSGVGYQIVHRERDVIGAADCLEEALGLIRQQLVHDIRQMGHGMQPLGGGHHSPAYQIHRLRVADSRGIHRDEFRLLNEYDVTLVAAVSVPFFVAKVWAQMYDDYADWTRGSHDRTLELLTNRVTDPLGTMMRETPAKPRIPWSRRRNLDL